MKMPDWLEVVGPPKGTLAEDGRSVSFEMRVVRPALDRLVVGWCRMSGSHFIEPWFWWVMSDHPLPSEQRGHHGCESCTWCVECGRLVGREAVEGAE